MTVSQREIVEINFRLPEGNFEPHPAIVLSNSDTINEENYFVCVMITNHNFSDNYTFYLTNEMLSKPMKKKCQVRLHLITSAQTNQIISKHGMIHHNAFTNLIKKINEQLFRI